MKVRFLRQIDKYFKDARLKAEGSKAQIQQGIQGQERKDATLNFVLGNVLDGVDLPIDHGTYEASRLGSAL